PETHNRFHHRQIGVPQHGAAADVRDRPWPHPAAQVHRAARALPAPHGQRHQASPHVAPDEV
ncbi:uncharacterized protein METZ01_LOCUS222002, partial [marine metagenome]